uniref:Uncharacterized protein n=1 Tax=Parascaris univalens TaxID=6257 RepID=A0A915C609_PARUN
MCGCLDGCLPHAATTNLRHYCCFGRIHVKTGLLAIISIVAVVEILEIVLFITGKYSVPSGWQIFFEILEAVCFFSLISAYKTQRSLFLWPFMVSQFLVVMGVSLVSIICLQTFFFPQSAYREIFAKGLSSETDENNGAIRLRAIISFHFYFFSAIVESWALTITLACHRYFDEINEAREQRMRRNRNYDSGNHASTTGNQRRAIDRVAPDSFDNPNYSLPDSDGEDGPKPFQEHDGKTVIV